MHTLISTSYQLSVVSIALYFISAMSTRGSFISIFLYTFFANNVIGRHVVETTKNQMDVKLSGGNEAISHEAPWVISVQRFDYSALIFNHICGGSILKPHIIVTAAHCLQDFGLELGYIYAGRHNLTKQELSTQQQRRFNHSDIIIHEGFSYGISADDIGLIKLLDPFVMNEYVNKISLPLSNVVPYGSVRLYGWGRTINEGIGGVLLTAATAIIDIEECNRNFSSTVLDTNICTASEGVAGMKIGQLQSGYLINYFRQLVPEILADQSYKGLKTVRMT